MTLLYAFLTQRVLFYRCAAYAIVFTVVKIELNLILISWSPNLSENQYECTSASYVSLCFLD